MMLSSFSVFYNLKGRKIDTVCVCEREKDRQTYRGRWVVSTICWFKCPHTQSAGAEPADTKNLELGLGFLKGPQGLSST